MANQYKKQVEHMLNESVDASRSAIDQSLQWYANKVRIVTGGKTIKHGKSYRTTFDVNESLLYTYYYSPKHADTLKYYDTLPLILPLQMYQDGWLGLNLHYMPPKVRAVVFDDIVDNNKSKNKIQLAYAWVKAYGKHPIIKHGIKRYLADYLVSPLVAIESKEWKHAVMLPTQSFKKKTSEYVWGDFK